MTEVVYSGIDGKTYPAGGSTHATPQQVMDRLAELDQAHALRQNEYETAAGTRARLARQWDKRMAYAMVKAKGPNAETRKASAFIAALAEDDSKLYDAMTEAEAMYEACKVASRSEETRVSVGQSILRAQGRA